MTRREYERVHGYRWATALAFIQSAGEALTQHDDQIGD